MEEYFENPYYRFLEELILSVGIKMKLLEKNIFQY